MNDVFAGARPPAGRLLPTYHVLSPKPGEVCDVTILDERIYGLDTHWVTDDYAPKGRTRKCSDHEGHCPHCGRCPRRWLGFVAVADHVAKERRILAMGVVSAKRLAALATQYAGLRALRVTVSRVVGGPKSGLAFHPSTEASLQPMPKPHRLEDTVMNLLGCNSLPDWRLSADDISNLTEVS